jgi:hypothetical protein
MSGEKLCRMKIEGVKIWRAFREKGVLGGALRAAAVARNDLIGNVECFCFED